MAEVDSRGFAGLHVLTRDSISVIGTSGDDPSVADDLATRV